jgi:hypothetical protein
MSAKLINARNMTSSFSNREKMRRKPLSRRNNRSISLRRLYMARLYSHGPVHQQMQRPRGVTQIAQQLATLGCVVGLAGRQRKRYGRSSIRGNHMNLGGPSCAGLADGLGAVFFRAPVPSGCTFTAVLSKATASILMRTI